ncbi:MAG: RNA polymerase sigma factor [Gemmatimonadaceae bacterium]|nr:RNA polymerase sigma factor [Gemmatimonadaceae bacterium]
MSALAVSLPPIDDPTRRPLALVSTGMADGPPHTIDPWLADARAAASGDRRAFERLYRAHVDRVFSLCARMLADRTLAEEVTQDVFVRVWEKLPGFRGESALSTWIHRVATSVVLTRRKVDATRHGRLDDREDAVDILPAAPASVGDRMDLEQAIAALPPGARRIFVLHDVEGFTHEEIAEQLGITSGGSKAQLHRARMLLRAALNR